MNCMIAFSHVHWFLIYPIPRWRFLLVILKTFGFSFIRPKFFASPSLVQVLPCLLFHASFDLCGTCFTFLSCISVDLNCCIHLPHLQVLHARVKRVIVKSWQVRVSNVVSSLEFSWKAFSVINRSCPSSRLFLLSLWTNWPLTLISCIPWP